MKSSFSLLKYLFPIERLVLAFLIFTFIIYEIFGIPLRYPWGLYSERFEACVQMYTCGLLVSFFIVRLRQIKGLKEKLSWAVTWKEFKESFLSFSRIFYDARLLNAMILTFVAFVNIKHLIPFSNLWLFGTQRVQDSLIYSFENKLFGVNPTTFTLELLGTEISGLMSEIYILFYPYMALLVICMVMQRRKSLAQEFFLAFSLCWLLGGLIENAYPTWGPCFYKPELVEAASWKPLFSHARRTMAK